jgi:hypothetical protein
MNNSNGKNIPIVYLIYLHKFNRISFKNKLEVGKARTILTWLFRIPPNKVRNVFDEMEQHSLIKIQPGGQYLMIGESWCNFLKDFL